LSTTNGTCGACQPNQFANSTNSSTRRTSRIFEATIPGRLNAYAKWRRSRALPSTKGAPCGALTDDLSVQVDGARLRPSVALPRSVVEIYIENAPRCKSTATIHRKAHRTLLLQTVLLQTVAVGASVNLQLKRGSVWKFC